MFDYSEDHLSTMSLTAPTHADDRTLDEKFLGDLSAGNCASYQVEKRYYKKDGSIVWGRLTVSLIKDARVVWSRTFAPDDWGSVGKLYVPLRPYARLGDTVVLRLESRGIRGGMLKGNSASSLRSSRRQTTQSSARPSTAS